ncbi:MAG TPA: hypothetical protein VFD49_07360 [Candidatus Dormibacteraeota bacterium]|nr:hypothetical protein [Candidatus Dormibacteraeota bacterium]
MIEALRVARSTAVKARAQGLNALKAVVMTAPDQIRDRLRHLPTRARIDTAFGFRVGDVADPASAIRWSLRSMARRDAPLDDEVKKLEDRPDRLTSSLVPGLRSCLGSVRRWRPRSWSPPG